jgi:hypothetical protein
MWTKATDSVEGNSQLTQQKRSGCACPVPCRERDDNESKRLRKRLLVGKNPKKAFVVVTGCPPLPGGAGKALGT